MDREFTILKTWTNQKRLIDDDAYRTAESDAHQGLRATRPPDVIADQHGYAVTLFDSLSGRDRWMAKYMETYDEMLDPPHVRPYTIVGIYEDTSQRWADTVYATSAENAEAQAPINVIVAGVFEGQLSTVL